MPSPQNPHNPRSHLLLAALLAAALPACSMSFFTGEKKALPAPLEYNVTSPYDNATTLAIAPALNLSGSRDFDVLVVSDTLYEELQVVPGINVIPLNKTIAAMQKLGIRNIDDPKAAQKIAAALGADGLLIPAVTAYDPYNPPKMGLILQLYTPAGSSLNSPSHPISEVPVLLANPDKPTFASTELPSTSDKQPVAQVSGVFNATNQSVLRELRLFAAGRTQYDSALMDQKFLMDSDSYMRFVCHAMIRRLMELERQRLSDR